MAAAGLEKVKALVDEITKKLGKKDDDDGKEVISFRFRFVPRFRFLGWDAGGEG